MNIDELLDSIVSKLPSVNPNKKYWLIRTMGGRYYHDFVENKYVAIEPSGVTLLPLKDIERRAAGNPAQLSLMLKDYIKTINPKSSNRTIGLGASQIIRFLHEIKDGDIILIPSEHSDYVSIGEVDGDFLAVFTDEELKRMSCPFELKRKVKWLKSIPRAKLDVNLYMVFTTHQMINQVGRFANVIERSVNDFYVLYENAHLIINVETSNNIPAKDLFGFGNMLLDMVDEYATYANLDISSSDIEIQINLNSPGKLDLKSRVKKTTIILGALVFLGGGNFKILGVSVNAQGLPALIHSITEYLDHREDRELKEREFMKYHDTLKIKNPQEFNNLLNSDSKKNKYK